MSEKDNKRCNKCTDLQLLVNKTQEDYNKAANRVMELGGENNILRERIRELEEQIPNESPFHKSIAFWR